MIIPDSVIAAVPKSPLANDFIYGANKMWERLTLVHDGTIPYLAYDMATLANAVEMYYKGFIEVSGGEALEKASKNLMENSHSLIALTKHIEEYITYLSSDRSYSARDERFKFLKNLSSAYLDGRYHMFAIEANVSKEDFDKCFEWASKQRQFILDMILPPTKDQDKILSKEEDEYERELKGE